MNKLPFMPFYHLDWETSPHVRQMGPVARSYYLTLLIHQWREGSIPGTRQEIERILFTIPRDWAEKEYVEDPYAPKALDFKATLDTVLECFQSDGNGHLVNHRLEAIRRYHESVRAAKSNGGKFGRMKQLRGVPGESPGNQNKNQNQNQNTTPELGNKAFFFSTKKEPKKLGAEHPRKRKNSSSTFIRPGWIPKDSWDAYLEMRRRIRKPMTYRAMELASMALERLKAQGEDLTAVLNQSILNSWQGLFPLKGGQNGAGKQPQPSLSRNARAVQEYIQRTSGAVDGLPGKRTLGPA